MSYIYRHIRPDKNEVFYIGKGAEGTRRAWEKRRRNNHWHNIVNKNGGVYRVEILMDGLTDEEAGEKEIEFIELYGKISDGGTLCNMQDGGYHRSGYKLSEQAKANIAKASKGNKSRTGQKRSEAERRKQSESLKAVHRGWNKGIKWSAETRAKMSEAHKGNLSNTGKFWITNGVNNTLIFKGEDIPEGYRKGKIQKKIN